MGVLVYIVQFRLPAKVKRTQTAHFAIPIDGGLLKVRRVGNY